MNIVDPILFQCRWQPFDLALCAPGTMFGPVTYGRLERIIYSVGRKATEHGLERGKVAALFIKDPILHVAFILGLAKIGVVTVSGRDLSLPKQLHLDAIFADSPYQLGDARFVTVVDKSWAESEGPSPVDSKPTPAGEDDPCRMILTSGTTGFPKAAIRTTRHVMRHVQDIRTVYSSRFPTCSRIFLSVGFATGLNFTFLIHALSSGGAVFLPSPNPIDTIEALASYRVQAMLAAPYSLAQVSELCEKVPAFRGGLDVVISTGSMVSKALSERVRGLISTNFVCSYGSTEAGIAATGLSSELVKVNGAVGFVAPGVTVDIVDDAGNKLPPGKEGRVRIRSEGMVDGYIGDSDEMRRKFREEGFFPGDIGTITARGMLVISGRENAVFNLGGDKVHPEQIEAAMTSYAKLRDAAAFMMSGPIGDRRIGAALVWHGEADVSGLKEHLKRQLPGIFVPTLLVPIDAIPRNSSGKIDRAKLLEIVTQRSKELLRSGQTGGLPATEVARH